MGIGILNFSLGRDFWCFRIGQIISLLGDSCGGIALAWWVLEKTGSAASMSMVLAPAMVVRVFLLPLMGPIGDNFTRKKLIIIADIWRFTFMAILAAMVFFDYFHLGALVAIYIMTAFGSALFAAASKGIVPQLVSRESLQLASQQTQAIDSMAGILGGVVGGVVVTTLGVFGAFLIDTFSYLGAAFLTGKIRANTKPERKAIDQTTSAFQSWKNDLAGGFRVLYRAPVLFWFCVVAMLMNFTLAPMSVVLPVLAKMGQDMPPWFLGALETSISLGAIVGAVTLGGAKCYFKPHLFVTLSLAMIGVGVASLASISNVLYPLLVLFVIGIGSAWANIVIGTQISLSVPNDYLSRVGSIITFACNGISPLGVAMAGLLISGIGLNHTLILIGSVLVLLTPLMLLIPKFKELLSAEPGEAEYFFARHYPGAF